LDRIIINQSCGVLRAIARNELKGKWLIVSLCVYIYYNLVSTVPDIFNQFVSLGSITQYNEAIQQNVTFSYIAYFYLLFFSGVFTVGLCSFMIAFFRNKDINPGYIFNGFEYYFKCFALFFMVGLFTFLWLLLLVVPGIIAYIRYSQAYFILADDPTKGVMQCIEESKAMMNGNKEKYFLLALSYIGWLILATVPVFLLSDSKLIASDMVSFLASTAAAFLMCIVLAYMKTAQTAFYDLLTGHLRAKPAFDETAYHFAPNYGDDNENKTSDSETKDI
jgi:uncharacterized membrane protein